MHNIPRLFRYLLIVSLLHLFVFTLLRVVFYFYFKPADAAFSTAETMQSFLFGLRLDLQLSLLLVLPLFVFSGFRLLSPFEYDASRRFWLFFQFTAFAAVLYLYFNNFLFFMHNTQLLSARDSAYLFSADNMIRLFLTAVLALLLAALYGSLLNSLILYFSDVLVPLQTSLHKLLYALLGSLILLAGLYGQIGSRPLSLKDIPFAENTFPAQVAANPVLFYFTAVARGH